MNCSFHLFQHQSWMWTKVLSREKQQKLILAETDNIIIHWYTQKIWQKNSLILLLDVKDLLISFTTCLHTWCIKYNSGSFYPKWLQSCIEVINKALSNEVKTEDQITNSSHVALEFFDIKCVGLHHFHFFFSLSPAVIWG